MWTRWMKDIVVKKKERVQKFINFVNQKFYGGGLGISFVCSLLLKSKKPETKKMMKSVRDGKT